MKAGGCAFSGSSMVSGQALLSAEMSSQIPGSSTELANDYTTQFLLVSSLQSSWQIKYTEEENTNISSEGRYSKITEKIQQFACMQRN